LVYLGAILKCEGENFYRRNPCAHRLTAQPVTRSLGLVAGSILKKLLLGFQKSSFVLATNRPLEERAKSFLGTSLHKGALLGSAATLTFIGR